MAMLVELLKTQMADAADKQAQADLHQQCVHVLQQLQNADPLRSHYWTMQQQQHSKQLAAT